MTPTAPNVVPDQTLGSSSQGRGMKMLPPKQILQRLLILLAQVQSGNTSENLLNEIRKIVCSLYQAKQISKMYTIIYSNQYKDEYNFNKFREQQDLYSIDTKKLNLAK